MREPLQYLFGPSVLYTLHSAGCFTIIVLTMYRSSGGSLGWFDLPEWSFFCYGGYVAQAKYFSVLGLNEKQIEALPARFLSLVKYIFEAVDMRRTVCIMRQRFQRSHFMELLLSSDFTVVAASASRSEKRFEGYKWGGG